MNIPEKVKEKELIWKTSLIRSEFLKIYFDEMGVNEEVSIDRLTNLYDCFKDNNNNKFLFAIVRVNENSENIKKALDTEVKEGTSFRMLENTDIKIMFPTYKPKNFHHSVNFLELAMTGFLNQKQPNLYEENSELQAFFKRLNKKCNKHNNTDFDEFDKLQ